MKGYEDFEFDLREALLDKLVEKFDSMEAGALTDETAGKIPDAQGVYQLLLNGHLVYVGKTDADAGLRSRLRRHAQKILHRKGLNPSHVSFKALRLYVFAPMDLESVLIKRYGGVREVAWNGSGFGSNDPGRERDTSRVKPEHFDALYPIDLDHKIEFRVRGRHAASDVLVKLKAALPYVLRFELARGKKVPHADIASTNVELGRNEATARTVIETVVKHLPAGWQATGFPGYVILYKETVDYPHGQTLARSNS